MKNKKVASSTLKKINKVYNFLINNPYSSFYKDKYRNAGIKFKTIKTLKQFEALPFLTKDEILNEDPYRFLFLPKNSIDHVGITSGTTNQNKPLALLINSRAKPKNEARRFQKFYDLNIKAVMLLYSNLTAAHRFQINHYLAENGIINVLGDLSNLTLSAKIAKRMQVDAIETTSSILYFFIPYLKKEYDLDKIRLISLGGEYTSEQKYRYLKKLFKNAYFKFTFGTVEVGSIGTRCDYLAKLAPRYFHPWDNLCIEVLNPEKEGELIVTGIEKGKWPFLIRYKTGNWVKITDYKCPCGETQLIELFGKIGHDVFKVQGTFIYSSHIYQTLTPYLKYLQFPEFKLHVYEVIKKDKIKTRLVLQVVNKKTLTNLNEAKEKITRGVSQNLFLSSKTTLSDLVEKNVFMPLEVEFVESLPFSPKQTNIISHII